MKTILLPIFLFSYLNILCQQWIDQQYAYDSTLNETYGTSNDFNGNNVSLAMDIYEPKCPVNSQISRWPLLIVIHGGAFIEGSKNDASVQDYCKEFARRGYVTASISYRLGFISDENTWSCNYPSYNCLFASDTAEWIRANYRGIQDAKGALRYLINRNQQFSIDTNNVFLVGESAGSFIALGVGLMNDMQERPSATFALPSLPAPNANMSNCTHNVGEVFAASISRPDLGDIDGGIEPSQVHYTIKGIGNMFGAMFNNLLINHPANIAKPAIYSYHQPCDIIVPIGSKEVFWGLDWCMTNGYNCYAIANTPIVHGSQAISDWNNQGNFGYNIQNNFTANNFPNQFAFVPGSCLDQANNPCHAYDNMNLRQLQMATFFAPMISSNELCQSLSLIEPTYYFNLYPNPSHDEVSLYTNVTGRINLEILDLAGKSILTTYNTSGSISLVNLKQGIYLVKVQSDGKTVGLIRLIKN